MKKALTLTLAASALVCVDALAVNVLTIDFDANAGYAYGFNEFYGYGSSNSGGNQAEGAWGATAATPFVESAGELPGVGVGASDGLQTSINTTDLEVAAIQDANARFGDTSVDYAYWGGSFGTGANPSAITTVDLTQIVFSIDADFSGVESVGSSFRMDVQFQGGTGGDILFRLSVPIDPSATGFNSYGGALSDFTVVSGDAADIADDFTNVNFNLQAENGHVGFGIDDNNVITADNLVIEQIPEPGVTSLFGLLGLLWILRRRSR